MPLKLSLYRPCVKANDVIGKQRIGESERIEINQLIQRLQIVFITLFKHFVFVVVVLFFFSFFFFCVQALFDRNVFIAIQKNK